MEKNVGESLDFPPSPQPSPILAETNVPSSKEPNQQMEPQSTMVETAKSSEGSPLNSENDPNPTMESPISSTDDLQENEEFPKPIIMIVPAGEDIVSTILDYARDRDVSILVHHASGVYTKCLSPMPPKNIPFSFFNIQFSREEAPEVYGGLVGNKLIAAQSVQVTASLFKEHDYYEYRGMNSPITGPNFQPPIVSNDPNATTPNTNTNTNTTNTNTNTNTVHDHGFFSGGSTSSPMITLPFSGPSPPIDFSKHPNNPTNPGDDY